MPSRETDINKNSSPQTSGHYSHTDVFLTSPVSLFREFFPTAARSILAIFLTKCKGNVKMCGICTMINVFRFVSPAQQLQNGYILIRPVNANIQSDQAYFCNSQSKWRLYMKEAGLLLDDFRTTTMQMRPFSFNRMDICEH